MFFRPFLLLFFFFFFVWLVGWYLLFELEGLVCFVILGLELN